MWRYSPYAHRLNHNRKGKRIRTNYDFEQNSKLLFTAVRVNISNKNGTLLTKTAVYLKKHETPSWKNTKPV